MEITKDFLKTGMIIETRNGDKHLLLRNAGDTHNDGVDWLIDISSGKYINLDDYRNDLTHRDDYFPELDITCVRVLNHLSDVMDMIRDETIEVMVYELDNPIESNKQSRRRDIEVGDWVVIHSKRGVVTRIDESDLDRLPYLVSFGNNYELWCQNTNHNNRYYITKEEE